jgi:exodeoxyribonuclease VIII
VGLPSVSIEVVPRTAIELRINKEKSVNNVMIDLETLGQRPGCSIISIGAVAFDERTGALGPELYLVVSRDSCREAGLHEDQSTIDWWMGQSDEAKEVLLETESEEALSLTEALKQLKQYLDQFNLSKVKVWGCGSDFDNAILTCCYAAIDQELPWKFWNNRCYRTIKSLDKGPKPKRVGTYHNALDDAKTQAIHAIQILR